MTGGFTVDHAALARFSSTLRTARHRLETAGEGAPAGVDAGDCTPLVAGLLAHLAEDAGRLSTQLAVAADEIDRSDQTYRSADQASADVIHAVTGPV